MSISLRCDECKTTLTFSDTAAGKRGKCTCGNIVTIPGSPAAVPQGLNTRAAGSRKRPSGRKTLFGVLGALGVIVIIAAGAFALSGKLGYDIGSIWGGSPPVEAQTLSALDYVPGDVTGLGFVNVRQIARAGLIDKLLDEASEQAKRKGKEDPGKVLKEANFDPSEDLFDMAIMVEDGNIKGLKDTEKGAAILAGRFDPKAIMAAVLEGIPLTRRDAVSGYPAIRGPDDGLVCLIEDKLIVAGNESSVLRIIDVYQGKRSPLRSNSPVMNRVGGFMDKTFWLHTELDVPKTDPGPGQMSPTSMMPGLDPSKFKSIVLGGDVTKDAFSLAVRLGCEDQASALGNQSGLQFGLNMIGGMAGMFTGGVTEAQQAVNELIQAIQIGSEGKTTTIDLTITKAMADRLSKAMKKVQAQQQKG